MTLIFIGALVGMTKLLDIQKIKANWPEYRCRPDVMLTANLYGHDASENIEFCLNNGFQERAKVAMGPFYSFLSMFVKILMTLLTSINSIRMIFATIVGSVSKIFSEFAVRINAFMYRIQATAMRIKWLMGRVFASMYSVLFMGMAGIKAVTNFSNTFLFKFLDTFCFDPDTLIRTARGVIPIKDVVIGDILQNGERVTATFSFYADGQEMVTLPNAGTPILVSTNHYIQWEGRWIHTADHPFATPAPSWSGGLDRPLICLNTDTHMFTIGNHIFRDYDETEEGDMETMENVLQQLNGTNEPQTTSVKEYACCVAGTTSIKTASGFALAKDIELGQELSFGKVAGIVKKVISQHCCIQGNLVAPGTAVWDSTTHCWKRAGDLVPAEDAPPGTIFYSFVVTPSASLETANGVIFRDYVEIHSPDTEQAYSAALETPALIHTIGCS